MTISKKKTKKINIILAVLIIFIILYNTDILNPVKNVIYSIYLPIQEKIYSLSLKIKDNYSFPFISLKDKYFLQKENIYLKEKIEDLKIDNINIKLLQNENDDLKELLNFQETNNYAHIPANIIGKTEGEANILILNKGDKDGIKKGLAVINQKGMIIGKILETSIASSKILLINDNHSRIAASILEHPETNGVVEGEFGLSMKMNLIPQNIPIKEGDVIITSGLEIDIPYGLVIGEINKVERNDRDLFQSANVQPLSPLDGAFIVSVITLN